MSRLIRAAWRHSFVLVSLLIGLLASGCGGGDRPARIQLFGASTVWGWDGTGKAADYPEKAISDAFVQQGCAGLAVVTTEAHNGAESKDPLNGTFGFSKPWPQLVDADIVVVSFGSNDQDRGVTPEQYKANLRQLAKAPARVVFLTSLPQLMPDGSIAHHYAQEMRDVAAELGVPVIDAAAFALDIPGWFDLYATDHRHPNSAGYRLLAQALEAPALAPMIGCQVER